MTEQQLIDNIKTMDNLPPYDTGDKLLYSANSSFREGYDAGKADALRWIPIDERVPENDDYVLLSFDNFSVPCVGYYWKDADGGGTFMCDDEQNLTQVGLFVNAWMPLPKCYKEDEE